MGALKGFLVAAALLGGMPALDPCGTGARAFAAEARGCCKTCRKGKACGDSCIAADKTCHKPRGCACDA